MKNRFDEFRFEIDLFEYLENHIQPNIVFTG